MLRLWVQNQLFTWAETTLSSLWNIMVSRSVNPEISNCYYYWNLSYIFILELRFICPVGHLRKVLIQFLTTISKCKVARNFRLFRWINTTLDSHSGDRDRNRFCRMRIARATYYATGVTLHCYLFEWGRRVRLSLRNAFWAILLSRCNVDFLKRTWCLSRREINGMLKNPNFLSIIFSKDRSFHFIKESGLNIGDTRFILIGGSIQCLT